MVQSERSFFFARSGGKPLPRVSEAHKQQVRQRLLDAARNVIMRDGHEGATTRAIVAEAGLSAGALYTYFSSKEEVFEALAEESLGVGLTVRRLQVEAGADPLELVRIFAAELLTEPDLPALAWFRGRMSTDPDVQAAALRFNRYVVDTFTQIIDGVPGARRNRDISALVELFDVIVEGINKRQVLGTFATSFERVGAAALQLLVETLANPNEGET
jgi:AcrR family transcriptional regulator